MEIKAGLRNADYFKIVAFIYFPHIHTNTNLKDTEIAGEDRRLKRNHGANEYQALASRSENTIVIAWIFHITKHILYIEFKIKMAMI